MNRKPKPPLGFVPVDSEEAKGIGDDLYVNYAYNNGESWAYGNTLMTNVKRWKKDPLKIHYHVQLRPPVEWEEVWAVKCGSVTGSEYLAKNGKHVLGMNALTKEQRDTIVAALNQMEERNGC